MPDEKLWTVAQVARRLGVKPSTIRRAVRRRQLTAVRFGRQIRIEQAAVDRYVGRCRVVAIDEDVPAVDVRQLHLFGQQPHGREAVEDARERAAAVEDVDEADRLSLAADAEASS